MPAAQIQGLEASSPRGRLSAHVGLPGLAVSTVCQRVCTLTGSPAELLESESAAPENPGRAAWPVSFIVGYSENDPKGIHLALERCGLCIRSEPLGRASRR